LTYGIKNLLTAFHLPGVGLGSIIPVTKRTPITTASFDRLGNSIVQWRRSGVQLLASAQVLSRERERAEPKGGGSGKAPMEMLTFWVELMLCAFGIECLLKALWLKKGGTLARNGRYQKVIGKENHNLANLCRVVSFQISARETAVLDKISEIARSAGRYPIATTSESMHEETGSWDGIEDKVLERFLVKLDAELRSQIPTHGAH
jgi:hypothetical protein